MESGSEEGRVPPWPPDQNALPPSPTGDAPVVIRELKRDVRLLMGFRERVLHSFPHLSSPPSPSPAGPGPPASPARCSSLSRFSTARFGRHGSSPYHHTGDSEVEETSDEMEGAWGESGSGKRYRVHRKRRMAHPVVPDSGFSTETKDNTSSSTERNHVYSDRHLLSSHCACASAAPPSTAAATVIGDDVRWARESSGERLEAQDELLDLLDAIHRKGVRLRRDLDEYMANRNEEKVRDYEERTLECALRESSFAATTTGRLSTIDEATSGAARGASSMDRLLSSQGGAASNILAQAYEGDSGQSSLLTEMERLRAENFELLERISELESALEEGTPSSRAETPRKDAGTDTPTDLPQQPFSLTKNSLSQRSAQSSSTHRSRSESRLQAHALTSSSSSSTLLAPPPPPSLPALPERVGVAPDRRKIAQLLQEKNILELKKQALLYMQAYEVSRRKLDLARDLWESRVREWSQASQEWQEEVEKGRDQTQELRLQLEARTIELEGTKAQLRMLTRSIENSGRSHTPTMGKVNPLPKTESSPVQFKVGGGPESLVSIPRDSMPTPVAASSAVKIMDLAPPPSSQLRGLAEGSSTESSSSKYKESIEAPLDIGVFQRASQNRTCTKDPHQLGLLRSKEQNFYFGHSPNLHRGGKPAFSGVLISVPSGKTGSIPNNMLVSPSVSPSLDVRRKNSKNSAEISFRPDALREDDDLIGRSPKDSPTAGGSAKSSKAASFLRNFLKLS